MYYYSDSSDSNRSKTPPFSSQTTSPPSPVIQRRNQSSINPYDDFFGTPKRAKLEIEKNSLSPRLGLVKRRRPSIQLQRFPHTVTHTPISKLGDLTGNSSHFLEMRAFDLRKTDTRHPERQFKERGGSYIFDLMIILISLCIH